MMEGTPYIYQGEELGMTNPNFDHISDYRDVESINMYHLLKEKGKSEEGIMAALKQKSRDNSRTPMQWNANKNSGFTEGTPWIRVASNYPTINAEAALQDTNSIYYHYQKLIQLRKEYDVIAYGDYRLLLETDPQIFAYLRSYQDESLLVVSNFYGRETEFHLPEDVQLKGASRILISNYPDTANNYHQLILRPYESVALYIK